MVNSIWGMHGPSLIGFTGTQGLQGPTGYAGGIGPMGPVGFPASGIPVRTISSQSSVTSADQQKLIRITSGSFNLTFDSSSSLNSDFWCYVENAGYGVVDLMPFTGQQLDQVSPSIKLNSGVSRLISYMPSGLGSLPLQQNIIDFKVFTGNGTWTPHPWTRYIIVDVIGGGGGGAGGRGSSTGNRQGGTGGGGGARNIFRLVSGQFLASESVVVGTGGGGGAGGSSANGSPGSVGGTSNFGTKIYAYGGGAGNGGASSGNKSSGAGGGQLSVGENGSAASNNGGLPRITSAIGGASLYGGAGSFVSRSGLHAAMGGASGGSCKPHPGDSYDGGMSIYGGGGGGGGGSTGGVGAWGGRGGHTDPLFSNGGTSGVPVTGLVNAGNGANGNYIWCGAGGGGGASALAGGDGGNGGIPGGGGGGGGAAGSGGGGDGGTGGRGEVRVWSYG